MSDLAHKNHKMLHNSPSPKYHRAIGTPKFRDGGNHLFCLHIVYLNNYSEAIIIHLHYTNIDWG